MRNAATHVRVGSLAPRDATTATLDALPVTPHHLRAPDFAVTAESRFWAPESEGAPPWVVAAPVLRRQGEPDEG